MQRFLAVLRQDGIVAARSDGTAQELLIRQILLLSWQLIKLCQGLQRMGYLLRSGQLSSRSIGVSLHLSHAVALVNLVRVHALEQFRLLELLQQERALRSNDRVDQPVSNL